MTKKRKTELQYYELSEYRKRLGNSYLEMCDVSFWDYPIAFTLPLKYYYQFEGRTVSRAPHEHEKMITQMLKIVYRRLYGRRWKKKLASKSSLRLKNIFFLEDKDVRPHLHGLIDKPFDIPENIFAELVEEAWAGLHFGLPRVDQRACYKAAGWINYIGKFRTKKVFEDSLDLTNFYNPQPAKFSGLRRDRAKKSAARSIVSRRARKACQANRNRLSRSALRNANKGSVRPSLVKLSKR